MENQHGLLGRSWLPAETDSGSLRTRLGLTQRRGEPQPAIASAEAEITLKNTNWLVGKAEHKIRRKQDDYFSKVAAMNGQEDREISGCVHMAAKHPFDAEALVQYSKPQMPVQSPCTPGKVRALTSGSIPEAGPPPPTLTSSLLLAAQKESAVTGQRSEQPNAPNARRLSMKFT